MQPTELQALTAALEAPFDLAAVDFKPQVVKGNSGLVATYVDARAVAERLDTVFPLAWESSEVVVESTPDKLAVCCTITLILPDGQKVSRSDVGVSDNGEREADRHKSAWSDAFKRAAVKFGVGRYLYDLGKTWADYDPVKKTWTPDGLKKLEGAYRASVARLAPSAPRSAQEARRAPAATPRASQEPAPVAAAPEAAEGRITDALRRALMGALTSAGLPYPSGKDEKAEKLKRYVRGFVVFAATGDVQGVPASINDLPQDLARAALDKLGVVPAHVLVDDYRAHLDELRQVAQMSA